MSEKILNLNKALESIPVTRSSLPDYEEYIKEIRVLWDNHWLTNMGEKHKKLEQELLSYLETPNITLFTNGHLALECALAALDLKGEVITTPFTFASTTHAIVRAGLKPVFCDVTPSNYTMDPDKIEALITENTSAILPVHVYGNICDVKRIDEIAKKHNLKVIYDAAHSFGIRVNNESIANFGDISMFSFHATKVFNTIEGGALTFKDPLLKQKLNNIKNFGITGQETVVFVGGNAKMNEFQAAMGLCNLRHVDSEIRKRKLIVNYYRQQLSHVAGIKLIPRQAGIKENYAYFPIVLDGFSKTRDELFDALRQNGIIARKYFFPIISEFDCYKDQFNSEETPIALSISKNVLTLPLYADLTFEDVDRICEIIKR
jgi:dTDP-4-amino-4,6-dideoxygalactose transaminase